MADIVYLWFNSEKEKYSPDLIDQLNEYKNSLLPIAEKNKDKKGKNIPSTMVINHFTKSYPRPKVLIGADKLEYFVGETPNGKLRIYNLHDIHKSITKSDESHMFVSDWIMEVLKNSDVFIDVFLEYGVPSKDYRIKRRPSYFYSQGEMTRTIDNLEDCMIHKKDCPTPNSRVHGVDPRGRSDIIDHIKLILYRNKGDKITDSTINSIVEYLFRAMQSRLYLKQYKNAPDCIKEIDEVLKERIKYKIDEMKKEYTINEIIINVNIIKAKIGIILMDAYLLGRLFRKFDIRPSDRGMPKNVQNVIIYTGGDHSRFYSKMLYHCGFKLKYVKRSKIRMERKLDISNIPYPLFRD